MAQLGARFHGMEEVIGSIPIRSTNQTPYKGVWREGWGVLPFLKASSVH